MRLTVVILITLLPVLTFAFEPISTSAIVGATSLLGYIYYNYFSCEKNECCNEPWVYKRPHLDFSDLYGQPLVTQVVSEVFKRRHLKSKPVALSFHGPIGTGKSFLSTLIAKMMFKKGKESEFVHFFTTGYHFPNPSKGFEYHAMVTKIISTSLSKCEKSVFIFDEFDHVPPEVTTAIAPFLEPKGFVNKVSTGQATFIFLSTLGSKSIVSKTHEMWKNGINRHEFKLRDFESVISLAVFNEEGVYKNSALIKRQLIDAFVPFLPLEKQHVESCIKAVFWEFKKRDPSPKEVEEIIADIKFSSELNELYAETGCKKATALVLRHHPVG